MIYQYFPLFECHLWGKRETVIWWDTKLQLPNMIFGALAIELRTTLRKSHMLPFKPSLTFYTKCVVFLGPQFNRIYVHLKISSSLSIFLIHDLSIFSVVRVPFVRKKRNRDLVGYKTTTSKYDIRCSINWATNQIKEVTHICSQGFIFIKLYNGIQKSFGGMDGT